MANEKLNIPDNNIPGSQSKIVLPSDYQLNKAIVPKVNIGNVDPTAGIKKADANLIIKSFGIPFLQTEIYKGRIPITERDKSPINRLSKLGTPIFSDLQFHDINGLVHIPVDTVLFDVHQAKNIVRTSINGRDGQIKEYIGQDDYEINIKGVICGENGVYPWDHVANLVKFLRYEQSLGITSKFLNDLFDIQEVVVYDYKFEQSEGSQSFQKFTIDCWSEKPVEILISEAQMGSTASL